MTFENFVADWLTITESDITAVPNPGGTGGAAPAFTTNFDFSSVLEPDGATMGLNNQVQRTSSGLDLGAVADGSVGYDRMHRVFGVPTFGGGLGNFNIEWEFAYWDGMGRGTGYVVVGLANSTAARFYNGAGKGITPTPAGGAGWDLMVDDTAGLWFGEDGSGGTLVAATTDLVAAGLPARVDGTVYFSALVWDDVAKTLTYSEYTDATRATLVASVVITPANTAFTATTLVCTTNENQIKNSFSGRDQECTFKNLNLNMISGPQATITATELNETAAIVADVQKTFTIQTLQDKDGVDLPDGTVVHAMLASTWPANPQNVGSGVVAGGAGSVSFNTTTGADIYLVSDPTDVNMLIGGKVQTLLTTAITPSIV